MMRVMHGTKNVREQEAEKWREKGCKCRWMRRGTGLFICGTVGRGSIVAKTIKGRILLGTCRRIPRTNSPTTIGSARMKWGCEDP